MLLRHVFTAILIVGLVLVPAGSAAAASVEVPSYTYATPVLGLAASPDGSLLVADAGSGIVELRQGQGSLVAALPGVSDIAPIGRGDMYAVTGGGPGPTNGKLYRVSRGHAVQIADLAAYEATVNPVPPEINPNPFDVAALTGGKALVADAGGNDLLIVDQRGNIDWVATLPDQIVSTANAKHLAGCPTPPAEFAFVCGLPDMMPAQPVATSIAIGPDGAYYMGELTGFPGPIGVSRIWRIEPGTLHAQCGSSPACSVVKSGFTSIVDLNFGPDGTLYVTEIDEASFLAVELGAPTGGTVNACNTTNWTCTEVATGLTIPTATATDKDGNLYATVAALIPGAAQVIQLP